MADQEACSEDLCRDNECETDGRIHGESLLLPLLQGLLDAPENSEQTPDSGTESGEDLRGGLIVEVQSALDKLSASLRNESTEISSEKRNSLLQLVSRLQAGLSSQTTTNNIANPERRNSGSSGSGQGRFAKRRQRQNRHTVGVTTEELEDARRLMEEIAFRENAAKITPLTKQNSEGAVIGKRAFAPAIYSPKSPVTNAIAKPFSNATTSTVETPTDASECTDPFAKQSVSSDENKKHVNCDKKTNSESKRSLSESNSLDVKQIADVKIAHHVAPKPNKNQQEEEASNHTTPTLSPLFHAASPTSTAQSPKNTIVVPSESETDEDPSTLKAPPLVRQHVEQNSEMSNEKPIVASLASENPTYKSHLLEDHGKYGGRFNSDKKLKMKRANTIDIPKPVHIYDDDDDYNDDDNDEIDIDRNARRSNYYALRGPIRVTTPKNGNDGPPTFEAKTESDRKFMAFINKHNDNNASKGTLWGQTRSANQGTNWTRKFGNIRTAFERAAEGDEKPTPTSKARSFWQTADDTVTAGRASTVIGPTISRQNARNLQQMFEEKQRQKTSQIKAPSWPEHEQQNVVTGSLKVDTKKNYRVVSQNVPAVNNFSHAPLSAFKPIARNPPRVEDDTLSVPTNVVKAAISDQRNPEQPLYLYSPKPLAAASPSDSCDSAPLSPKPAPKLSKLHNHAESRVMSIATAKFENPAPPHDCLVKPKKSKSEKVAIPPAIQRPHENGTEKVTAPYITRTVGSNTVRKLSDQYDNLGNLSQPQISPTNPKYVPSYANPITKQTYSNKPIGGGQSAFAPYSPPQDSYQHNHHQQHAQQQHHYTPHQPSHNFSVPSQTPQYQPPQYQRPQYQPQQYQPPQYSSVPHASLMKDDSWQRKATYPEPSVTYSVYPDRPLPQQQQQQQQQYYNQQPQHYHQQQQQQPNYNQQQYAPQHYYQQPPQPQHNYPPHYEPSYNPQRYEAPPHNQYQTYDRPSSNAHNKQPQSYNYYQPQQIVEQPVANKPIAVYNNVCKRPETSQLQRNAPTSTSLKLQKAEQHRPELQKQLSNDNVKEYNAINSRVMTGPVGQQAVTVAQNKPKSRGEHDMDAAFSLKNSLKSIAQNSNEMAVKQQQQQQQQQRKKTTSSVQNHQQQKMPDFRLNDKPVNLQSLEINERGESIVTSTFRIPVVKTSPSSMAPSTASSQVASSKGTSDVPKRTSPSALSKCESWHQIVHDQVANKPSPRASPNSRTVVRSKSSHTLNLPKQFEAGMSKDEMQSKKKSIAAYFGATSAATTKQSSSKSKSSINRIKTSQKLSTATSSATAVVAASGVSSSTGLSRSKTLPDFACSTKLLDESNVDVAFEDLFKSSS